MTKAHNIIYPHYLITMEKIEFYFNQAFSWVDKLGAGPILSAIIIFIVGWFIAKFISGIVKRLLKKTKWDDKLVGGGQVKKEASGFFGKLVYYIIMLFVLMLVLSKLGLSEALTPLNNLTTEFMAAIPNIVAAGLVGYIGYMLAKIVSNLVGMGGGAADNWISKTGFKDTDKFVDILKKLVFIVILVPIVIQALALLKMDAISGPAIGLLEGFTGVIGKVLVAAAVLFLFIWGGGFVRDFLKDLFASLGFDTYADKLGVSNMMGEGQTVSKLVSGLIFFFIAFFGIITAVDILGMEKLSGIFNNLLGMTGQIFFGLAILLIGNFISKMIYDALSKGEGNQFVANIIRWASLALFAAIALRQMGIADSIIDLAFGLILGAIAVAIALAYGLGGREAAGRHFHEILDKFRR